MIDRLMNSEVILVEWSSNMDLCAILMINN